MKSLTLDEMRHAARLAGFEWTDDELAALRPGLVRALEALEALERLPLEDTEPTTQYRVL